MKRTLAVIITALTVSFSGIVYAVEQDVAPGLETEMKNNATPATEMKDMKEMPEQQGIGST